jgi:hypothetical protein
MRRTGPIAWPPRSPDLNPLEDYFLSGVSLNGMYQKGKLETKQKLNIEFFDVRHCRLGNNRHFEECIVSTSVSNKTPLEISAAMYQLTPRIV